MTEEQKQLVQDFNSGQAPEPKTLSEQAIESAKKEQEPVNNLQIAENILTTLYPQFGMRLDKLSNKQLRRVIMTLVKFPFLEKHEMKLKTQEEKAAFMFGERLIYANMVKRARAELDRTFGEVAKEQNGENTNGNSGGALEDGGSASEIASSATINSGENSVSDGSSETQGNPQV